MLETLTCMQLAYFRSFTNVLSKTTFTYCFPKSQAKGTISVKNKPQEDNLGCLDCHSSKRTG